MRFTNPFALLLLLLLIPVFRIGWPGRGPARRREISALALRTAIIVLLVLAISGPELLKRSDRLSVVFLLDASDSVSKANQDSARSYVAAAIENMEPDDQAAVILFGGEALVERPMSADRELGSFRSLPNTTQTDLGEAVRLAMAIFPPDTARRIVLISDGRQTSGDLESAARLASDSGIDFLAIPLPAENPGGEVTLLSVDLPGQLIQGENFDARISLHATRPGNAGLRIFAAGELLYEGGLALEVGSQTFRVPLTAGSPGFTNFVVQIAAVEDQFYQNNGLSAYAQVSGPPKILVVAPPEGEVLPVVGTTRPDESSHLVNALNAAGFTVETVRPAGLSFELALLSEYASIILVDVPARDLTNRQMEALQSYVRDLGGGLVTVGGPTSYGVGGYFRTPLEETLPVDMEIKDQERRPTLTMVFIIDRSGSMNDSSSGFTKLELAREAAARSVELLFPGDRVGVIAFDDSASWVVPITELSDPESVVQQIESIGVGGGTDILAGLQAMADALPQDDALVKHVILLTDGGASTIGIPSLVEGLYQQYGITLTTVGVGSDAAPFLADIAVLGGGRYHFTDRPESIPSIFTEETTLATRSYIVEETFFPVQTSRSPILSGLVETPALHGYVGVSSKSTAQTVLISELGDPILASWQYGLGRAVSWTSDATARWASSWVGWDGFPTFWAQVVRFTVGDRPTSPLDVRVTPEGETTRIRVDALAENGSFLNGLELTANVIAPDGRVQQVRVPQTAPGYYEGSFAPDSEGTYLIRIDGQQPNGESSVSQIAGWVLSYSPEYRPIAGSAPDDLLRRAAESAGGRLSGLDQVGMAFDHSLPTPDSSQPIWPLLVTAVLLMLPFDIAVRRLAIDRRDILRAWERISASLASGAARQVPAPQSAHLSSLLQAKDRAKAPGEKGSKPGPQSPTEQPAQAQPAGAPEEKRAPEVYIRPGALERSPDSRQAPGEPAAGSEDAPTSTTSTLLARKRARQQRQGGKRED